MRRFAGDSDFPDNGFEAWGGYMQAKVSKLEEQFSSRANTEDRVSNIFNGVSIYVNGYTKPSADELKTLMSQHGGVYHTYHRSDDYIIASNLPDTKVKNQSLLKVVKPEWIVNSIAGNQLLDYREYLLYKDSRTQPKLNFNRTFKAENTHDSIKIENIACDTNESSTSEPFCKPSVPVNIHNNSSIDKKAEVTKTAADPNFISEFYNNSRLHHISQLGACFKQHINDLRDASDFKFPSRIEFKAVLARSNPHNFTKPNFQSGKIIMHIDMDCFFVSVGLRNRPELRGRPIAVTHSKGGHRPTKRPGVDRQAESNLYKQKIAKSINKAAGASEDNTEIEIETRLDDIEDEDSKYGSLSEIASCSYEARAKGVKNGMFMGAALKLCPDLVTIPYDFEGYKEVAYTLYNTLAQYTLDIEAVSCDEMYADCTELIKSLDTDAPTFATALREEIRSKTGCPCSTGFGGNRLQARLATKFAKPDGQYFLTADLVDDFMMEIKLRDLPGVGRQTSQKLEALGHITCGSLQSLTLPILQQQLGTKTGAQLYDQCRGRDLNPLSFLTVRKSVSAEVNYGIRFENNEQCSQFLTQLSEEVHNRMNQFKVSGKCITLKLMVRAEEAPVETAKFMGHGYCNVINKSVTLAAPTNDLQVITREILNICKKLNVDPKEMRGVGIHISKLESKINKNVNGAMSKYLSSTNKQQSSKNTVPDIIQDTIKITADHTVYTNKIQTTPKKSKPVTPSKKQSPILGSLKTPPKRRKRNAKTLASASVNVMNRFLQGVNYVLPKIPVETVEQKPNRNTIASNGDRTVENSINDMTNLPWRTVRDMVRAWVDSKSLPLQCDVDFLSKYLTNMIINKQIDKVNIIINFLKRKTEDLSSREWTDVYESIVGVVQNAMIAVYGKKLLL